MIYYESFILHSQTLCIKRCMNRYQAHTHLFDHEEMCMRLRSIHNGFTDEQKEILHMIVKGDKPQESGTLSYLITSGVIVIK